MNRRVFALLLCAAVLLVCPHAAFAEERSASWDVTFTGDNRLESGYTASELASKVYEMLPGDTITLRLELKNDNGRDANWYMSNRVLESLESASSATGGAYEYELIYYNSSGDREVLFTSDTVGGERADLSDRVGLETATEGLEDDFFLERIPAGGTGAVTLKVSLDGETQGNDYQNTLARLQISFAVDPVLSRTEVVTTRRTTVVRTGDRNELLPFIIAAAVSGLLLLVLALVGLRERKRLKKAAGKALCFLLICALLVTPALESGVEAAGRTYTVRLFSGAQGELREVQQGVSDGGVTITSDGDVLVISGLRYGQRVTLNPYELIEVPEDSRYQIKGIRVSGREELCNSNLPVTGDCDYVVAYKVSGDMVRYTVEYVDAEGNALADPEYFRGSVGDRAVVACRYIEGYRPPAYNAGKVLTADEAENVIRFVYTPLDVETVTQTVVEETTGVTVVEGGGEITVIDDRPTPLPEYQDIDDQNVPLSEWKLADILAEFATPFMNLPLSVRLAMAGTVILLGLLAVVLIIKKRKKKDAQDS